MLGHNSTFTKRKTKHSSPFTATPLREIRCTVKLILLKTIDASGISGPPWSYGVTPASSNHASRRRWAGHRPARSGFMRTSTLRRDGERGRCFTRGGHDWAVAGNKCGAKAWAVIGSILRPVYAILAAILPHKTLTTLLSHLTWFNLITTRKLAHEES